MPGNRRFKSLFYRGPNRVCFYIEPERIKRLGWKQGDDLVMTFGVNGEAYLCRLEGIPVKLSVQKSPKNDQYFVTFPAYKRVVRKLRKVRITEALKGLIINFF